MEYDRESGILLHITSLPSPYGIGTVGKAAYDFVDFLKSANQKLWQIFPLGPTGYGDSPYQTFSAFAGNPLLIDLDLLCDDGLIAKSDLDAQFDDEKVDYGFVINFKNGIFEKAFKNFVPTAEFDKFCADNSWWLDDFSLFMALKKYFGGISWNQWDEPFKLRDKDTLNRYSDILHKKILFEKFLQYLFYSQWEILKKYANQNGVKIIGDIPIFVGFDSSDAWANSEAFQFDENLNPTHVAGVPPDDFSATGQLWGNPLYNWDKLKESDYDWWIKRFSQTLKTVDIIRLDHFLGFVNYWSVKATDKTAENGEWKKGPGSDFFDAVVFKLKELPIIAEDLGVITDEVTKLREKFGFPGMKILQFAFYGDDSNPYLPHNIEENFVVYTGTHDNETTIGWYKNLPENIRKRVNEYLQIDGSNIAYKMIEAAWKSKARMAIVPMQDFLSLDNSARMNAPGTVGQNWQWRIKKEQISDELVEEILDLTVESQRNRS